MSETQNCSPIRPVTVGCHRPDITHALHHATSNAQSNRGDGCEGGGGDGGTRHAACALPSAAPLPHARDAVVALTLASTNHATSPRANDPLATRLHGMYQSTASRAIRPQNASGDCATRRRRCAATTRERDRCDRGRASRAAMRSVWQMSHMRETITIDESDNFEIAGEFAAANTTARGKIRALNGSTETESARAAASQRGRVNKLAR